MLEMCLGTSWTSDFISPGPSRDSAGENVNAGGEHFVVNFFLSPVDGWDGFYLWIAKVPHDPIKI